MSSQWLVPWLVSLDDDEEANDYPNGLNPYFNNSGINYMNLLKNLGSTLVYIILVLVAFLFMFCLWPLQKTSPRIRKVVKVVQDQLQWGFTLTFIYQQM